MAIYPIDPLRPLYGRIDEILREDAQRHIDLLREGSPDVHVETDDGGGVHVIHGTPDSRDPSQLAFPGIPGSTDQTGKLIAMVENYDYAAQGEWMATVEQRLQRAFRMIEIATERLNGEHADQPNEKSIEDLRSDVRQLWYRSASR